MLTASVKLLRSGLGCGDRARHRGRFERHNLVIELCSGRCARREADTELRLEKKQLLILLDAAISVGVVSLCRSR